MAKIFDRFREQLARDEIRFDKFLQSMLSKEVTTPETHTRPENLETKSTFLASCLGHYGNFTRIKWKQIHFMYILWTSVDKKI